MIAAMIVTAIQAAAPELPTGQERMMADGLALEAVKAFEIVEPLAKCVDGRIAGHAVPPEQIGNAGAAIRFAVAQMAPCGAEDSRMRVLTAIRAKDPTLAPEDAERRADTELGMVLATAAMKAFDRFRIEARARPPVKVLVPCPPRTDPQPKACQDQAAPETDHAQH